MIKINEIFYDIEGEGKNSGIPTLFIRVTGCNLRCQWCDTKYAYYKGKKITLKFLANKINKSPYRYINITGGEPLLYKKEIKTLLKMIKGKYVTIETNGSISVKDIKCDNISMDIKLPSSGEHKKMLFENLKYLKRKDQVKLVVGSEYDMIYAKKILKKYKTKAQIIIQPVYKKISLDNIKEFILKNKLEWKLSVQLHKLKNF